MSNNIDNDRVELDRARNALALTWFIGGPVIVLLVIAQAIFGRMEGFAQEFFAWFTPMIFPTLGLIGGVVFTTAQEDDSGRTVKRLFYLIALGASVIYLAVLLATLLLEPLAWTHDMAFFSFSSYWLGPIQTIVVAAVGALFNSRKKTD
jgi:cytochrome bd-type quinol oxidase subunit 2